MADTGKIDLTTNPLSGSGQGTPRSHRQESSFAQRGLLLAP